MIRLQSDLASLCLSALEGKLDECTTQWDPRPAVGVVLAAGGYPASYRKGDVISGFPSDESIGKVFHAGTSLNSDGDVTTNGGRVLCATALGNSVTEAQEKAYQLTRAISWDDVYYRDDIAYRAIEREKV